MRGLSKKNLSSYFSHSFPLPVIRRIGAPNVLCYTNIQISEYAKCPKFRFSVVHCKVLFCSFEYIIFPTSFSPNIINSMLWQARSRIGLLTNDDILEQLDALQQLLDHVINCQVWINALHSILSLILSGNIMTR